MSVVSMTLSELERRDARANFSGGSTYLSQNDQTWQGNTCEDTGILVVSHAMILRERDPAFVNFLDHLNQWLKWFCEAGGLT